MTPSNLFTMLSAFRPGSGATPFENYCTSGLAYFLERGHRMLTALVRNAAGAHGEDLALVEVQPFIAGAGVADMVLTFEGGKRAVVEVQVEPGADARMVDAVEEIVRYWPERPALIMLTLPTTVVPEQWTPVTWLEVTEALEDDPDPLAWQFAEFVLRDILGLGPVPLEQALTTNRLYALGGAAVRKRYGRRVRYVNSCSRPTSGRYRYLGTTFALDEGDMAFWLGIINEAVPLTEHYYIMLATKTVPVLEPGERPRATGDWKEWQHWTGSGRVVRPITVDAYDELLDRLQLP
jgi:hypothetical protein